MSGCAALNVTRVGARIALAGLLGIWLAGCSSDTTRFSDPFMNPFNTASNDAAPTPHANVASNAPAQPNANFAAIAHPSPVAVAALPAPAPTTTGTIARPTDTQPVTGFGDGWRAAGGSPIVVADGENLDAISRRYGVPASALLHANGDGWLGKLHMRVPHQHARAGHRLHEMGHAVHHLIGRAKARAVIDQQDGFHDAPSVTSSAAES